MGAGQGIFGKFSLLHLDVLRGIVTNIRLAAMANLFGAGAQGLGAATSAVADAADAGFATPRTAGTRGARGA